jgi:Collagen-binding surface adhesin SpaP (antigen I/II family)
MRFSNIVIAAAAGAFLLSGCSQYPKLVEDYTRPRVIVTCDPELDDNNSMYGRTGESISRSLHQNYLNNRITTIIQ